MGGKSVGGQGQGRRGEGGGDSQAHLGQEEWICRWNAERFLMCIGAHVLITCQQVLLISTLHSPHENFSIA